MVPAFLMFQLRVLFNGGGGVSLLARAMTAAASMQLSPGKTSAFWWSTQAEQGSPAAVSLI